MASAYPFAEIEKKWLRVWEKERPYRAVDFDKRKKFYGLVEFPYPSGEGLHIGHAFTNVIMDVLARKKRMAGFNVLHPMGWDSFGLPTENYAIKTGVHPTTITERNTKRFHKQNNYLGISYDWSREIDTSNSGYYHWTQWIFIQLFKHGLAYKAETPVGWCPSCKIILANEEIVAGECERCGATAEHRRQAQWLLRITAYADRLVDDLKLVDYPDYVKQAQINWIGRSEGVYLDFLVEGNRRKITVFTTAIDTVYGTTFLVLAPEYAQGLLDLVPQGKRESITKYIKESLKESELERKATEKAKSGVEMGISAANPFTREAMPIFVADYVLMEYGTGAVMGVSGHDARDHEFAVKYNLPIKIVIKPAPGIKEKVLLGEDGFWDYPEIKEHARQAILCNSGPFNGLTAKEAKDKLEIDLEKQKIGKRTVQYHLRDWIFSRQHYWGEPIPMIYCPNCAAKGVSWWDTGEGKKFRPQIPNAKYYIPNTSLAGWFPVPEDQLPVELPPVERYQPTDTGESPLANVKDWVSVACPECGGAARRETDTMPNWAGSSWYFLRYCDPDNKSSLADFKKLKYWLPVDLYVGGAEHTTLHLLYSRFWHKFLFDLGTTPTPEPYARRRQHGIILAEDGAKMSKSRGNVVNPDEVISKFGSDTLRVYLMFLGPYEQTMPWSTKGILGVYRFLAKVWRAFRQRLTESTDSGLREQLARLIKKVGEDIESLKFNTAIAAMMEFLNHWGKKGLSQKDAGIFLRLLAPFAPFITEELWVKLGNKGSIHQSAWPEAPKVSEREKNVVVPVQINGKLRGTVEIKEKTDLGPQDLLKIIQQDDKLSAKIMGLKIKRVVYVPGKIINLVS